MDNMLRREFLAASLAAPAAVAAPAGIKLGVDLFSLRTQGWSAFEFLDYCAKYNVKKVVVLSSANVYGPSPENSNFLTEDAPLMAASRFSEVRDLIEVDMLAHGFFWRHPEKQTVILRPVHIVGPNIKNAPSNYLRLPRPWSVAG